MKRSYKKKGIFILEHIAIVQKNIQIFICGPKLDKNVRNKLCEVNGKFNQQEIPDIHEKDTYKTSHKHRATDKQTWQKQKKNDQNKKEMSSERR